MIGLARFQAKEFGKLWSDKLWSQLFMGGGGGGGYGLLKIKLLYKRIFFIEISTLSRNGLFYQKSTGYPKKSEL